MKRFFTYAGVQALMYILLVYNYRMIALGNIPFALLTDGLYALCSFTLIRKIAREEHSHVGMAGYFFGSLIGTTIGMLI